MRKIQFDTETIEAIREYVSAGHTMDQTQNRFNLKYDTLKRVMYKNDIALSCNNQIFDEVSDEQKILICSLYSCINATVQDIAKIVKLPYCSVQKFLDENCSKEFQDKRNAKLYLVSKSCEESCHEKDLIEDGNGYLMSVRPDWYTGRVGKRYVYQHTIVMCEHLGITELPKGMVVHHIDYNKKNNDISNLALLTAGAHAKLHAIERNMCKGAETIRNGVGNSDNAQAPDN